MLQTPRRSCEGLPTPTQTHRYQTKVAVRGMKCNELGCVLTKIYLWILKFQTYCAFTWYKIFSLLKNICRPQAIQKLTASASQLPGWIIRVYYWNQQPRESKDA